MSEDLMPEDVSEEGIEKFIANLRNKLSFLPPDDTSEFAGLYSATLNSPTTQPGCRLIITPCIDGKKQELRQIVLYIPAAYKDRANHFLEAAKSVLEARGLIDRNAPAATLALEKAAAGGIDDSIKERLDKLRQDLTLPPRSGDAKSSSTFSGLYTATLARDQKRLRIVITTVRSGKRQELQSIDLGIPAIYHNQATRFLEAVKNCLQQEYGLFERNQPEAGQALNHAATQDLGTNVQEYLVKLRNSLTLPSRVNDMESSLPFAGLYSAALDTRDRCRIVITPVQNGEKEEILKIDLHIPALYRHEAPRFVEAAKKCLEDEYGLLERDDPNAQQVLEHATEGGLEDRLQTLITNFRIRITSLIPIASTAEPMPLTGYYSLNVDNTQDTRCRVIITPLKNGTWQNFQQIDLHVPAVDRSRIKRYKDAIRNCLEQEYGLISSQRTPAQPEVVRIVAGELQGIDVRYPDEFAAREDGVTRGIFTVSKRLPSTEKKKEHNIGLEINIRSLTDYMARNQRYILKPAIFEINTNTRDINVAEEAEQLVKTAMQTNGFEECDLSLTSKQDKADKEIPRRWIDPEKLRIRANTKGIYSILLTNEADRKPLIHWSTGTRNRELAARKLAITRNQFLPMYAPGGEREQEPLTLGALSEYMQIHCPQTDTTVFKATRHDARTVLVNGIPRLRLNTPDLDAHKSGYSCTLNFEPLGSHGKMNRTIELSVNTLDRVLAEARARQLQTLTQLVLEHYFRQHPERTIVTEERDRYYNGQTQPLKIFHIPELGEQPPHGQVFFRTLADEVLKPAYEDFNRYIYWETGVERAPDNRYRITCTARRNDNAEALSPDTSSFQGPLVLFSNSKDAADDFCAHLEDEIIRQQYIFSRERGVKNFGQTSAGVAIRESLRSALQESNGVEPDEAQKVLLQTLRGRRY